MLSRDGQADANPVWTWYQSSWTVIVVTDYLIHLNFPDVKMWHTHKKGIFETVKHTSNNLATKQVYSLSHVIKTSRALLFLSQHTHAHPHHHCIFNRSLCSGGHLLVYKNVFFLPPRVYSHTNNQYSVETSQIATRLNATELKAEIWG